MKDYMNLSEFKLYKSIDECENFDEINIVIENFIEENSLNEGLAGAVKGIAGMIAAIIKKIESIKSTLSRQLKAANKIFQKSIDGKKRAGKMAEVKELRKKHTLYLEAKRTAAAADIEEQQNKIKKLKELQKKYKAKRKSEIIPGKKLKIGNFEIGTRAHKMQPGTDVGNVPASKMGTVNM